MTRETLGNLLAQYYSLPGEKITKTDVAGVFILTKDRDGATNTLRAVEAALQIGYTMGYNAGATMRGEMDTTEEHGKGARA